MDLARHATQRRPPTPTTARLQLTQPTMNDDDRIIMQIQIARAYRVPLKMIGINIRNVDRRRVTKQIALADHRTRVERRKELPRSQKPS
jgi:hypothetical protein